MADLNFDNPILIDLPMPIETERLMIREPRAGDGQAMHDAKTETQELLQQWMFWAKELGTMEDDEARVREKHADFILRKDLMMLVFEKETGRFVGSTGLHRFDWSKRHFDTGYWFRQSAQGKGYATESTKALIRYAFDVLQARKLIICHADGNEASKRVIEKCGFRHEYSRVKADLMPNGDIIDDHFYSLFHADHLNDFQVTWG